jgi:hypothetical protein
MIFFLVAGSDLRLGLDQRYELPQTLSNVWKTTNISVKFIVLLVASQITSFY